MGKNTRLRLVFSPTLLSCSTASCVLYNRRERSRGFFFVNLNAEYVSVEYFEQANLRLEDAILTLLLLLYSVWQSEESVIQDFETVIEAVLTKVCFSCNDKV